MKDSLHKFLLTALVLLPVSASAQSAKTPLLSAQKERSESQAKISRNPDLSKETRGLADSKLPNPGETVPAPDNGTKATMTRDAVASGRFNQTVDGSAAKGSTDPVRPKGTTAQDNNNTGIAPTISNNDVIGNDNNASSNRNIVGTSTLSPGSTSSANTPVTDSLRGPSKKAGLSDNNADTGLRGSSTTDPSAPGQGTGTLSNSTSLSGTAAPLGIAGSATSSLSSDGRSANTSSLSGSTAGSGSLSSGSSSGGSGGGGGGL